MKNRKTKKGFTIVELVIVIAVIGILSAILIPTFVNLTSQAQEAAKKQQVQSAYTAYALEATDQEYNNLFTKAGSDYTAYANKVELVQRAQNQLVIKLANNSWFTYDSSKGWVESNTDPWNDAQHTKDLVCKPFNADVAEANYLYQKVADDNYVQLLSGDAPLAYATANEQMSTFNGVVVYYKTVA